MIRTFAAALAFACLAAAPASAQTGTDTEVSRASHALAALWRPIPALESAAIEAACGGAVEEIAAVESALPPVLTPESVARVRALHGLLIIPTDDPAVSYFFPDLTMPWFTSGLGGLTVLDEGEGFIGVTDAGGESIALQLGRAGQRGILRLRAPEGAIVNFVACAPTQAS
jgi:hypothetical protein